jgi:hypothetical protein
MKQTFGLAVSMGLLLAWPGVSAHACCNLIPSA